MILYFLFGEMGKTVTVFPIAALLYRFFLGSRFHCFSKWRNTGSKRYR